GSDAGELSVQLIETERTEVERGGMEGLQVERRALTRARRVAGREPHPLTDLVADRLAGPAEVPIDLARHEVAREMAALDHERKGQLRRPPLARVIALVTRDGELEVHADVDDDAHRAHHLRTQHPELVVRIVEVAQLAHQ